MSSEPLEKQRKAGRIAKEALELGKSLVEEGAKLYDIAEEIEHFVRKRGARPAFPVTLAVNEVAAHYTPKHNDRTVLQRGDLVKVDVGVHIDGYIADNAGTVEVGTRNWSRLIEASLMGLEAAIDVVKAGVKLKMIGAVIERTVESLGYKPISNLTGHSLERYELHAGKSVPNIQDNSNERILAGEVLAIEPFTTNGAGKVDGKRSGNIFRLVKFKEVKPERAYELLRFIHEEFRSLPFAERWCYSFDKRATADLQRLLRQGVVMTYPILSDKAGGMVAQSEHTVIVREKGCEVITR